MKTFKCRECRFAAWCVAFAREGAGCAHDTPIEIGKCVRCGRLWGISDTKLIDLSKHTLPVGRSTSDLSTCPRCGAAVGESMHLIWRGKGGCWEFIVQHRENSLCEWGEITSQIGGRERKRERKGERKR